MNEEEEKAIEYFKGSFNKTLPPFWYDDTIANNEVQIKILLNLIDKLQEGINQEKEKNKKLEEENKQAFKDYRSTSAELYRVINMMAEDVIHYSIPDDFCSRYGKRKKTCKTLNNDRACLECIKAYYFKKVRGGEDETN